MHMSTGHWDRSVNLCLGCFNALAEVLDHASKKLRLGGNSIPFTEVQKGSERWSQKNFAASKVRQHQIW
jgi:hypothetical protein